MSDSDPAEVTEDQDVFEAWWARVPSDYLTPQKRYIARLAWMECLRRERAARREGEAGLRKAAQAMLDLEALRMRESSPDPYATVRPCPCPGCNGLRAAPSHPPEPDSADEAGPIVSRVKVNLATGEMKSLPVDQPEPARATESERDRLVRERDAARDALGQLRKCISTSATGMLYLLSGEPERKAVERADAALALSGGGEGKA